jgi:hypothetical protein
MADIFNAFVRGQEIGTQQRLLREQQQREEKINALSGQAFNAAPDQVNQLARTATELGGAQAGAQIQTIAQGQNELVNQRRNQVFETIARRVASVAQIPEGPEREAAWAAGVNEVVTDPAQRDQLLALGSAQGITTVASQIAPVGDLLAKMGFSVPGGAVSARAAGFEQLASGLSPEDQMNARRVELGLAPRAVAPGFSIQEVVLPDGTKQYIQVPTRGVAPGQAFAVNQLDGVPTAGGAPAPAPAPAAAPAPVSSAQFTTADGRPVNINFADFAALEPSSRASLLSQLEQETGVVIPPAQRAQLLGSQPTEQPQPAPRTGAGLGRTTEEEAEAAALQARRVEEERRRAQAAVEAEVSAPANERARALALENAERTRQTVRDAIEQVTPTSAGFVGARLRGVEGTGAFNLSRTIDTIKANLSFGALQAMRDASPTGGALGGISEGELNLLGATVQSLDPDQSPEEIARKLAEVQYYYERTIARIENRDADSVPRPAGLSPAPAAEIRSPSGVVIRPRNR